MRVRSPAAVVTLALAVVSAAAGTARAEPLNRAGFEGSVHVGAGLFTNALRLDGATEWAPGSRDTSAAIQIHLAYRLGALLDVGVHLAHQWFSVGGLEAGTDATATAAAAGLVARLHVLAPLFPRLPLDLTLGAGLDFLAYARQTTTAPGVGGAITEERGSIPGLALPVEVGLDVLFGDAAFGVLALWAPWWSVETCRAAGTALPACAQRSGEPSHYLFVGAGLRVHLEFVE